jgi:hypothetical protein
MISNELKTIADHYGLLRQQNKLIEESAELILAV